MGQAAAPFVAARATCPERDRYQQPTAAALGGDRSEPASRKAVPSPRSSARWHEGDDGMRVMTARGQCQQRAGMRREEALFCLLLPTPCTALRTSTLGSCSSQGAGGAQIPVRNPRLCGEGQGSLQGAVQWGRPSSSRTPKPCRYPSGGACGSWSSPRVSFPQSVLLPCL